MLDDAIKDFLSKKKTDRIKKKITPRLTCEEKWLIEQEADKDFLLENWLPDAAKKAKQLHITSHPGKFSHPDAKISAIIAVGKRSCDGFLRTGNAYADMDVVGNAAVLDVYKFLSLGLNDGMTVLQHLECNSEKIRKELYILSAPFDELRSQLLSMKKIPLQAVTSGKVKQVYFPMAENYHLLSVLTPSGLLFELRNRIQSIRFSEAAKEARQAKRKNVCHDTGFSDLPRLAIVGFGGSNPQNISALNSTYAGKAYLLPSIPPPLTQKNQPLPKSDFFINNLWPKNFSDEFHALHKLLKTDYNNKAIRESITERIQSIMDEIIKKMWAIRLQPKGWSDRANFTKLPVHQKIWLDEAHIEERYLDDEWLHDIIIKCSGWIIRAYKKVLGHQAVVLADDELLHIQSILEKNKEDLR